MQRLAEELDGFFVQVLPEVQRAYEADPPSPAEMHNQVRKSIHSAEQGVGHRMGWNDAKYAIAAWIDDILINAPWDSEKREWWKNHLLEHEYFGSSVRATEFYTRAQSLQGKPGQLEALEVFYLVVLLGFRGCYREEPLRHDLLPTSLRNLPPNLGGWLDDVARQVPKPTSIVISPGQPPDCVGAVAGTGKQIFVLPVLVAVCLLVLILALAWPYPKATDDDARLPVPLSAGATL